MTAYQRLETTESVSEPYPHHTNANGSCCPRIRTIFLLTIFIVAAIYISPQVFPSVWDQIFALLDTNETIYTNIYTNISSSESYKATIPLRKMERPIILAWTKFLTQPMIDMFYGPKNGWKPYTNKVSITPFREDDCPFRCIYTDNRSNKEYVKKAAVMIFHVWNNDLDLNANDLPPPNPDRLNVFFQTESVLESGSSYKSEKVQNMFNLTMTYSPKSDIYLPYDKFEPIGRSKPRPEEIWSEKELNDKIANKSELVLQFVSHCTSHSGREKYVAELAKHIKVDIYGKCTKKCPTEDDRDHYDGMKNEDCFEREIGKHMFYLSFENTICNYYTSEKFWHIKKLIVPIVLSHRSLQGLNVPKDSYICIEDFASPKHLADYLLKLQKNKALYKKYFNWTKSYKKTPSDQQPLCELCRLAVERRRQKKFNIAQWWQKDGSCEGSELVDRMLKG
ncbi:glycosyltransferase family 10 (fucosyltransferase) c-term domain-containing protein [Ditylenchus destructor]|uniref:Fucosyltransferase n=1 Tax=Ditylenchus destructor TaxID=166010 RepID=A0AAD4R1I8_9BILA|nr:glycosyltransferase family 10 (fucosyltransferase) c-term domain-containing protein [Ditylenchus destructor]